MWRYTTPRLAFFITRFGDAHSVEIDTNKEDNFGKDLMSLFKESFSPEQKSHRYCNQTSFLALRTHQAKIEETTLQLAIAEHLCKIGLSGDESQSSPTNIVTLRNVVVQRKENADENEFYWLLREPSGERVGEEEVNRFILDWSGQPTEWIIRQDAPLRDVFDFFRTQYGHLPSADNLKKPLVNHCLRAIRNGTFTVVDLVAMTRLFSSGVPSGIGEVFESFVKQTLASPIAVLHQKRILRFVVYLCGVVLRSGLIPEQKEAIALARFDLVDRLERIDETVGNCELYDTSSLIQIFQEQADKELQRRASWYVEIESRVLKWIPMFGEQSVQEGTYGRTMHWLMNKVLNAMSDGDLLDFWKSHSSSQFNEAKLGLLLAVQRTQFNPSGWGDLWEAITRRGQSFPRLERQKQWKSLLLVFASKPNLLKKLNFTDSTEWIVTQLLPESSHTPDLQDVTNHFVGLVLQRLLASSDSSFSARDLASLTSLSRYIFSDSATTKSIFTEEGQPLVNQPGSLMLLSSVGRLACHLIWRYTERYVPLILNEANWFRVLGDWIFWIVGGGGKVEPSEIEVPTQQSSELGSGGPLVPSTPQAAAQQANFLKLLHLLTSKMKIVSTELYDIVSTCPSLTARERLLLLVNIFPHGQDSPARAVKLQVEQIILELPPTAALGLLSAALGSVLSTIDHQKGMHQRDQSMVEYLLQQIVGVVNPSVSKARLIALQDIITMLERMRKATFLTSEQAKNFERDMFKRFAQSFISASLISTVLRWLVIGLFIVAFVLGYSFNSVYAARHPKLYSYDTKRLQGSAHGEHLKVKSAEAVIEAVKPTTSTLLRRKMLNNSVVVLAHDADPITFNLRHRSLLELIPEVVEECEVPVLFKIHTNDVQELLRISMMRIQQCCYTTFWGKMCEKLSFAYRRPKDYIKAIREKSRLKPVFFFEVEPHIRVTSEMLEELLSTFGNCIVIAHHRSLLSASDALELDKPVTFYDLKKQRKQLTKCIFPCYLLHTRPQHDAPQQALGRNSKGNGDSMVSVFNIKYPLLGKFVSKADSFSLAQLIAETALSEVDLAADIIGTIASVPFRDHKMVLLPLGSALAQHYLSSPRSFNAPKSYGWIAMVRKWLDLLVKKIPFCGGMKEGSMQPKASVVNLC